MLAKLHGAAVDFLTFRINCLAGFIHKGNLYDSAFDFLCLI